MKLIAKPINFLKEVKLELEKVSWPTRRELIDSTIVVIATTALMALFIAAIDLLLSRMVSILLR